MDLTGNETVWDLCCGIGTISPLLAQKAKQVFGMEIIPAAIEDVSCDSAMLARDLRILCDGGYEVQKVRG